MRSARKFFAPFAVFLLLPFLFSCARYIPIPWRDVPGKMGSAEAAGRRLAASLEAGLRARRKAEARGKKKAPGSYRPLRIVVAAFAEARSGVRTLLSERIERAVRAALSRSPLFEVVDGGAGLAWQEAYQRKKASPPSDGFSELDTAPPGAIHDEIRLDVLGGLSLDEARQKRARALDGDHPNRGLWHRAQGGAYGAETAIQAAAIFDAEAAVFGAYALGPERIRIWAGLVKNAPRQAAYFQKRLADILGEAEREKNARDYLARARASLLRRQVSPEWLAHWLAPRPRLRPRHPPYWRAPAFEIAFEGIDPDGRRFPMSSNAVVGPKMQVVGRIGVGSPHYVYGFSIDETGRTRAVFSRPGRAEPVRVLPGKDAYFTARLLPAGRSFRILFVSARKTFKPGPLMEAARRRFGFSPPAGRGRAQSGWFLPPGQEALILDNRWDQKVFWFVRRKSP